MPPRVLVLSASVGAGHLRAAQAVELALRRRAPDAGVHRLGVHAPCERYCTAAEEGVLYLQSFGVPPAATRVTGIPVHPAFAEQKARDECRRRQGIAGGRPVVLQLAGGFGVGPIT